MPKRKKMKRSNKMPKEVTPPKQHEVIQKRCRYKNGKVKGVPNRSAAPVNHEPTKKRKSTVLKKERLSTTKQYSDENTIDLTQSSKISQLVKKQKGSKKIQKRHYKKVD